MTSFFFFVYQKSQHDKNRMKKPASFKQSKRDIQKKFLIVLVCFAAFFLFVLFSRSADSEFFPDGILIDVRSPSEFASNHLQNAINIPLPYLEQQISKHVESKDTPINVVCLSGARARTAKSILLKNGYTKVANLGTQGNARKLYNM